jgi:membrane dipeptidase
MMVAGMNRRDVLKTIGAAAAAALLARNARARQKESLDGRYRNAIVINGNMAVSIDSTGHLDAATSNEVRKSGLTALKLSFGGSGSQSKAEVDASIPDMDKAIQLNRDLFMRVRSVADIWTAKKSGRVGIIYSFEAAAMLEGRLDNIDHFRRQDVLAMGLSYNGESPFASGVLAPRATGLTPLGREAVQRMNSLGVTVDLSHSDENSSFSALSVSTKPVLITHAGCAAIHPHPRNKSDRLLRALAANGGVMGIYELSYLVAPPAQPTLEDYIRHLSHALTICGEDHVGIGTDGSMTKFDTSPANMTAWYKEIARRKATGVAAPGEGPPPFVRGLNRSDRSEVIADALARRGYSWRTIEKVLGANFLRVFNETWTANTQ